MRSGAWLTLLLALALALGCGPARITARVPPAAPDVRSSLRAGSGYYLTEPPRGLELPANAAGAAIQPKVTPDFAGVPVSNDWWSSLIWPFDARRGAYSGPLYAHPLVLRAEADGLGLSYPTRPEIDRRDYMFRYDEDLRVGLEGLRAPATLVAGYGDWTVTAAWTAAGSELRASFGHGLPFVYARRTQGSARARIAPRRRDGVPVEVFHQGEGWLGLAIGEHHYGVYGPSGAEWTARDGEFGSDLGGGDFFSVAILPDREPDTLALFRRHAYAFVKDTRVEFGYDAARAVVRTQFRLACELIEPGPDREAAPLVALYRHQWRATRAPLLPKSYVSPRGEMKLLAADAFDVERRFHGVLPLLPVLPSEDRDDLAFFVKEARWADELFPAGPGETRRDAYWVGKSLLKIALVAEIADQIGDAESRDQLVLALENELDDWFDGRPPSLFYYDRAWRTLIGAPAAFGSSRELNDHHFHYGYFVFAAAIVARHDPAWARRAAPFVELLIKDAANWERDDTRFPFLRYMDPYAGHSWANGPALFAEGNNQESSSEDVNFSAAVLLWGAALGDARLRDLGAFLYSEQVAAIREYWFDVDRAVFPQGFGHGTVAMVWGAGGRYDTWWDPSAISVHAINFLPFTGASLYLGLHPSYVLANQAELVRRNRGQPLTWRDLHFMFLALADAPRARALLDAEPYFTPDFGNSRAMTYHHVDALRALGQLAPDVFADQPTAATFRNRDRRTHVAYNPTSAAMRVRFSDGAALNVPPRGYAHDARRAE